ncbi:RadC family protein [Filimonas effusa]|uniref:DNA repair protein RadC n=1 Tax=Filimonas effusa TaxID=2508721 RepID=A0A4V1M9V4_9BACT|nr:DNA repair protein RadC [Filimonas effusa]RXK82984.1 DNA repair protein RadC [Filimonas effusa]
MLSTKIKNWAEEDRPREKLMRKGVQHLSNSELIAILLNSGTRNTSAVAVAQQLLAAVNHDLQRLGKMSVQEIIKLNIKGVGSARAVAIAAALELTIRRTAQQLQGKTIKSTEEAAYFLRMLLQYRKQEMFAVLFLNTTNRVIHFEIISQGGITSTIADPRVILKKALVHDAVHVILCHNHPSGDTTPSKQDEIFTSRIKTAALLMDIHIIDHIIVGETGHYSFADNSLM